MAHFPDSAAHSPGASAYPRRSCAEIHGTKCPRARPRARASAHCSPALRCQSAWLITTGCAPTMKHCCPLYAMGSPTPGPPPRPSSCATQYRMKGAGDSKGIHGAVVVIINQPIRSLIRDGIDTAIAPTVTYFLCVPGTTLPLATKPTTSQPASQPASQPVSQPASQPEHAVSRLCRHRPEGPGLPPGCKSLPSLGLLVSPEAPWRHQHTITRLSVRLPPSTLPLPCTRQQGHQEGERWLPRDTVWRDWHVRQGRQRHTRNTLR